MNDAIDTDTLRQSFRDVLTAECPAQDVLRYINGDHGLAEKLWRLAVELGWTALSAPEAHGGLDLGISALAPLYQELGRAVAPVPMLGTMLVVHALARGATSAQQAAWLPRLIAGELPATLSAPGDLGAAVEMRRSGKIIRLNGTVRHLLDGGGAKLALVLARDGDGGTDRVIVEPAADGVAVKVSQTTDQTRSFGTLVFDDFRLPADRVLVGEARGATLEKALGRHAAIGIAADAAGGAAAVFQLTLDYMRTRHQFGRPIGSFQALKHRCADHQLALVASGVLLDEAVALEGSGEDATIETSAAKAYFADTYAAIAQDAVQLHGGIGFTWEYVCHLYLKRAKLDQALYGSAGFHFDQVAASLSERLAA